MIARLVQLDGDREVASFDLDTEVFRIGRDPSAELVASSSRVSRQHARIEASGSGHALVDLGTPNGSTVNGRPVAGREPLSHGDRIVIGGAILLVYRSGRVQGIALWVALGALLLGVAWVGFVYVSPWVVDQLGGATARASGPEEAAWDQAAALALGAAMVAVLPVYGGAGAHGGAWGPIIFFFAKLNDSHFGPNAALTIYGPLLPCLGVGAVFWMVRRRRARGKAD